MLPVPPQTRADQQKLRLEKGEGQREGPEMWGLSVDAPRAQDTPSGGQTLPDRQGPCSRVQDPVGCLRPPKGFQPAIAHACMHSVPGLGVDKRTASTQAGWPPVNHATA